MAPTNKQKNKTVTGLHNLFHPTIWDGSTWSKFGAHGEHGDVLLFSNLGALWFSENLIRYSLHVCLREVLKQSFFLQTIFFKAFLVTVLKILTYALVSTWSFGQLRMWARQTKNAPLVWGEEKNSLNKYVFIRSQAQLKGTCTVAKQVVF